MLSNPSMYPLSGPKLSTMKKNNPLSLQPFRDWRVQLSTLTSSTMLPKINDADGNENNGLVLFLKGVICEVGFGHTKDLTKAWNYYQRAADLNFPLAYLRMWEAFCGDDVYKFEIDRDKAIAHLIFAQVLTVIYFATKDVLQMSWELQVTLSTLKITPKKVSQILNSFEDGLIFRQREAVSIIFEFVYLEKLPENQILDNKKKIYENMMSKLGAYLEENDSEIAALAVFTVPLIPIPGIFDRKHEYAMKHCKRFSTELFNYAFQGLENAQRFNTLHFVYRKIIELSAIEIFWQIRYNSPNINKSERDRYCYKLVDGLNRIFHLVPNDISKFIVKDLLSRCYEYGIGIEQDYIKAIGVMESTKKLAKFKDEDFPHAQVAKLYHKIGYSEKSKTYYELFYLYSKEKKNYSIKFFRLGVYFEYFRNRYDKAMECYVLGLAKNPNMYTFQMEMYNIKCQRRIDKLLKKYPEGQQILDKCQDKIFPQVKQTEDLLKINNQQKNSNEDANEDDDAPIEENKQH